MNKGNFDNTGRLVRFMLRRERLIATIWIIILVLFSMVLAPGLDTMSVDDEARAQIAGIFDNPIMVSMMGPAYGDSTGALYSGMMLLWYLIAVAVMNIFLAVRHTRADEETGRAEVVRSLPVGRLAGINATMFTALIINTILALSTGLGLALTQTPTMDFAGCMLYGAVSGAAGLVFAAITLVFCQLSQSTSGAVGLSFLSLGVFYMLRAFGDIDSDFEILSWLSPLGLASRAKTFAGNSIVPLFIMLIAAAAIAALAYKLNSMRDLGQGFIPAKPGRSSAAESLLSPFGLSFRLLRKMIIIWLIIMFSLGGSYGTIIGDIGTYVSNMPQYLEIIGLPEEVVATLTDEQMTELTDEYADMIIEYFGVFITSMMTLIGLIPVMLAATRLRAEEKEGRLEHILSRAVSRKKYIVGFVSIAFVVSALMQLATAAGLYLVAATGEKNPFSFGGLLKAYISYVPAMWLIISAAILLIGFLPKISGAIWGYYGVVCFLVFIGGMPGLLPEWLTYISPMKFIPQLPLEEFSLSVMLIMTGLSIMLTVIGVIGYGKRDMTL